MGVVHRRNDTLPPFRKTYLPQFILIQHLDGLYPLTPFREVHVVFPVHATAVL